MTIPGMRVGTAVRYRQEARPVDGAVKTPGAVRLTRSAASVPATGRTARGRGRGPRGGPDHTAEEIVRHDMSPGRRGGVPHDPRGRDVVDPEGRTVFFDGHGAVVARLAGVPSASFSSAKVDGCAISAVQVRLHPAPPVPLDRPAHPDARSRATSAATVEQGPFSEIHRLHRSSCIGACRSTTTSPSSTGLSEKRFSPLKSSIFDGHLVRPVVAVRCPAIAFERAPLSRYAVMPVARKVNPRRARRS